MRKILLVIMAFALLSAGCQPTPQEDIISPKDTESMLDSAKQNNSDISILEMAKAPSNLQIAEELPSYHTNVKLSINAEIVLPDVQQIPIVHIKRGEASNELLRRFVEILGNGSKAIITYPKLYYSQQADYWEQKLQSGDYDKYESADAVNRVIHSFRQKENDAPEKPEYDRVAPLQRVIDDGFYDYMGVSKHGTIFNMVLSKNLRIAYIRDIRQSEDLEFYLLSVNPINFLQPMIERNEIKLVMPSCSLEDARITAENLIGELGFDNSFTCVGSRIAPFYSGDIDGAYQYGITCGYEILFTRQINGVNITFTNDEFSNDSSNPERYAEQWPYERLIVYVDDEGVLALLYYPQYDILEVTNVNASIISIDEAINRFSQWIGLKYAKAEGIMVKDGATILVTEIRLGLTRIIEKGNLDMGYLVPTWTFFGVCDLDNLGIDAKYGTGYDTTDALLVVNAIDGSIIDMSEGY